MEAHSAGDLLRFCRLLMQITPRIILGRWIEICQALRVLRVLNMVGLKILPDKLAVSL